MSPVKPRILCVSFSPIHADARVLRQIEVLQRHGEVTTVGYGEVPHDVARHIRVPDSAASLPQTPLGVLRLALRAHNAVELTAPGERAVLDEVLASGPYDLVVANDARALPLAFAAAGDAPVYADMHEWAPEERSTILVWRLLVAPHQTHLCRKYLPRAAAVTSVSAGLSNLYAETFGIPTETVRNAGPMSDLKPSPVDPDRIRLVHSGTADVERNIMELIEAVELLGERYTLDLYLLEVPGGHLAEIKQRAASSPRVTVHDPVPPETLPTTLNQYDLGVFLYPIQTRSHLYHLPNKFFDFVQARLGVIVGPSPEMARLVREHGIGAVTEDFTPAALTAVLDSLTPEQVAAWKQASHQAARPLSSDAQVQTWHRAVSALLP